MFLCFTNLVPPAFAHNSIRFVSNREPLFTRLLPEPIPLEEKDWSTEVEVTPMPRLSGCVTVSPRLMSTAARLRTLRISVNVLPRSNVRSAKKRLITWSTCPTAPLLVQVSTMFLYACIWEREDCCETLFWFVWYLTHYSFGLFSTVTVDEFMFKEGVQDQLDKLDRELVGLVPVKKRVKEIAALLVLDKMRRKLGFETAVPSLHMSFTGAPGTGKTTVAVRMGQILAKMGYSRSGHVVLATRDDLVGQYVGHTAPKTKEMIKKAMGGVLLIDEAYYLFNAANDRDYGQESIEILLNVMENNQDDLVVALAGYKDRMDTFFSYIPGMMSRVGNHINFPNYSADELVQIAAVMAGQLEYDIEEPAYRVFREYIAKRMELPFFSNARTVRNAMDRARMNSAIRTFEKYAIRGENGGVCSVKDLMCITAEDFQVLLDDINNADPSKVIFA